MSGIVQAAKVPQATEKSVTQPRELVRHINDIGALVAAQAQSVQRIPVTLGNLITGQKFTAGTVNYIAHGLGRAYLGYILINAPSATSPVLTQTFRANGTYTVPQNCNRLLLVGYGGGGGGGGGASGTGTTGVQNAGGSGGGGALLYSQIVLVTAGSSYSVTIGQGGAGGTGATSGVSNANNGSDGGDTTFGSLATFLGAGGGLGGFSGLTSTQFAVYPGGSATRTSPLVKALGGTTAGAGFVIPPSCGGYSGVWAGTFPSLKSDGLIEAGRRTG